MDNQQGTNCEIAWLAGFFEGEGTLSLRLQKRSLSEKGTRIPKIEIMLRIYNTDAKLIQKCVHVLNSMGIEPHLEEREQKPMIRPHGGFYKSFDPMLAVRIQKPHHMQKFLHALRPWIFGDKAARIDLMLEFLDRRLGMIASSGKGPTGNPYTDDDFKTVEKFYALTRPAKRNSHADSSTSNEQHAKAKMDSELT
jgi:hypothetical protein